MNKTTAIQAIISATSDQPIVFTTGYSCRIAKHIDDRPNHFYMTGSMGLAASIATGIAMATGSTTIAVDGDGSLLMNPSCLVTAGMTADLPLVHVLLDDSVYASTGGQATHAARADFVAWARATGYTAARTGNLEEFRRLLQDALSSSTPTLVHCLLAAEDSQVPPRIDLDLRDHQLRFSRHVRAALSADGRRNAGTAGASAPLRPGG
ncbi:thiamine pyrophosphate-dependent enzyme [Streptomyces sp. YGL11-2]|uniref:thiamine pyrophosphate-dependent enzyme n=1 Tax=Streptomyces sp. YGL11-2 TaxID=3414028 RepID=UPI003CF59707